MGGCDFAWGPADKSLALPMGLHSLCRTMAAVGRNVPRKDGIGKGPAVRSTRDRPRSVDRG